MLILESKLLHALFKFKFDDHNDYRVQFFYATIRKFYRILIFLTFAALLLISQSA